MTNNERFNRMLNSCQYPRRIYNTLLGFAEGQKTIPRAGKGEVAKAMNEKQELYAFLLKLESEREGCETE